MSARSRRDRAVYWTCATLVRILATFCYRLRVFGASRVPVSGPVLVVANHQSFLDPPLIGVALTSRPMHFLARASLFKSPAFAWLITALNSVPVREDAGDIAAIREIVARIRSGAAVLVFPEGSRTGDGRMAPFKRGAALMVRKAHCPVVPAAIEGAFEAWPRSRRLPSLFGHRVAVMFGDPIDPDDLFKDGPDAALTRLEAEVARMRAELRRRLDASDGRASADATD